MPGLTSTVVNDACLAFMDAWPGTMDAKGWNEFKPAFYEAVKVLFRAATGAAGEPQPREGLSPAQEPKYTVTGSAIVNRASGEPIPADEPVFVFRARDVHAREALEAYACVLTPGEHRDAVVQRVADFAAFSYAHPERMKEPDTAVPQADSGAAGGQGDSNA